MVWACRRHLVTTGHACNPHGAMQEFAGLHLAASTLHTVHPSLAASLGPACKERALLQTCLPAEQRSSSGVCTCLQVSTITQHGMSRARLRS